MHPDKCAHEKAAAAFEVIGEAQKFILDADRREVLMRVLEYAREAVRDVRRKATKNDSAVRMAAALNAEGREGVEKEWEETDDFHEKWRIKSQDVLARSEFRRRKLLKRYAWISHPCCGRISRQQDDFCIRACQVTCLQVRAPAVAPAVNCSKPVYLFGRVRMCRPLPARVQQISWVAACDG